MKAVTRNCIPCLGVPGGASWAIVSKSVGIVRSLYRAILQVIGKFITFHATICSSFSSDSTVYNRLIDRRC